MTSENKRNYISKKKEEITKLQQNTAKENLKILQAKKKISAAESSIKRTKSLQMIESKRREIERENKKIIEANKIIVKNQEKITHLEKDVNKAEKELIRLEKLEAQQRENTLAKQMQQIDTALEEQSIRQDYLDQEIQELKTLPKQITILFLASNPNDTDTLRLDQEARDIQEKIRTAKYRDNINFVSRWAVRVDDILQAVNEENPTIIHFSGHGCDTGEIVLEGLDGNAVTVNPAAFCRAISTVSNVVQLVVFNACYSEIQAKAIVEHINAAIGMSISISDDAAKIFATQLYSSIAFGLSIQQSFNQAVASLMMHSIPEENTPQLYGKPNVDLNTIFLVEK